MKNYALTDMHTLRPKIITVGDYSYGYENIRVIYGEQAELSIGNFSFIEKDLTVWFGGHHRIQFNSTYAFGYFYRDILDNLPPICNAVGKENGTSNGNIIIGNDVYIGANVIIMSGVKIGDGAVILPNSIVYNKVKPYSIISGNPATLQQFRFDEHIIKKLLEIKWWNWSTYNINRALPFICSTNPERLINFYDKYLKGVNEKSI
jgi:acetyltransferase-like isoleucine patch superfamily enzyme